MGYFIQYEPELNYKYKISSKTINKKAILFGCGIFICALILCVTPTIRQGIMRFLIPGDEEVTVAAFNRMVTQLRTGMNFPDAATHFCREILTNG